MVQCFVMPNPILGNTQQSGAGDERKERLQAFQAKSLEYAEAEKERVAERRQEHKDEQARFEAQGAAFVAEQQEAVEQSKEDRVAWKQRQAEQKAAIAKMKAEKERAEQELKERQAKAAEFEKKKKAYFASLQAAAQRNAAAKRRDQDAKVALEQGVHQAEKKMQASKSLADQQEKEAKNQSERELQTTEGSLHEEFKHGMQKLHAEELRKRMQLTQEHEGALALIPKDGPNTAMLRGQEQSRHTARMRALEDQYQKLRTEFEADIGLRKQQAKHNAIQTRTDAEHERRRQREVIDATYNQSVGQLRREYDHVIHTPIIPEETKK